MDEWIQQQQNVSYDKNGNWASLGKVDLYLLQDLLSHDYFQQASPKSTGRDIFNLPWLKENLATHRDTKAEDVQATLCELTAQSISMAINTLGMVDEVLVCGGGIHNQFLTQRLQALLAPLDIRSTAEFGIDPDWVEACGFAWLAHQTLTGKAGNLPSVTGATHPCILGAIYHKGTAN